MIAKRSDAPFVPGCGFHPGLNLSLPIHPNYYLYQVDHPYDIELLNVVVSERLVL